MDFRRLLRDENGAAAEFALVLPLLIVLLFGIIDAGRYIWEVNRAEKATQAGARAAVVTGMIPGGLIDYSFSVDSGLPQGSTVDASHFPGVQCTGGDAAPSCDWLAAPVDEIDLSPNASAFATVVERMQQFMPGLAPDDVVITYTNSSLGFSGDPNGPDVAPIVTVSLGDEVEFEPILTSVFGLNLPLPAVPYSLSQEDGIGTCFEDVC